MVYISYIKNRTKIGFVIALSVLCLLILASHGAMAANDVGQGPKIEVAPPDKVPPEITVSGVQDGAYYAADISPVVKVFDDQLSSSKVTLNGASYVGTPITRDGNYTLKADASDLSGNRSSKSLSFVVDKTTPVISVTGVDEGRYYSSDVLPVIIVRDANLKEKRVTLNGRMYPGSAITAEGSIELKVDAVDMAGNKSSLVRHFNIDKTLPVTTLQIGLPMITDSGKLFITASTPAVLTASDSGTGPSGINRIEYSLDGTSSWNIYKRSISLGTGEGLRKIYYRSIDNAGNVEFAKQSEVTVDNGAPVTLINVGEPKLLLKRGPLLVTQDTIFVLNASDNFSGTAKTEYRVNNGLWNSRSSFNIANDGHQLIEYRGVDRLGNTETAKSLNVIVDNTPPATTLSIGTPKFSTSDNRSFISANTVITLAATDALSEVAATEYRTDNGPWTSYAPINIQAEGEHQVEYRSRDQMGNLEKNRSATVIVDNSPPVSTISTGTPNFTSPDGTLLATGKTSLAISASDNLSGVAKTEYRIDAGAWKNYSVPFSVSTEGKHVISYRSIDNTGNLEPVLSLSITIDNTSPVTAINVGKPRYEAGNKLFITGIAAVSLNSTDNLAGLKKTEYRIDNGEWTAFNALIDLASLPDGKHSIGYRSSDNVGNVENEKLMMMVIDNAPPIARINMGMPFYTSADGVTYVTSQSSLTLNVTDTLSGVMKAEYRLDNAKWLLNAPFTISSEGNHLIESRNSDNLGNFETAKSLSVTVDNIPPVTTITAGTPRYDTAGFTFVTGKTEFTLNGVDNLSGVKQTQYRINGGGWTVYTAPFNLKSLPDGKQTIGYISFDNLGNMETEKNMSVVVDNTTPSSTIKISEPIYTAVNNVSYVTSATTFSLSAKDNLSGVKTTEYRLDNGQWLPASTFRISSEGNHKITYRSIDNLGNVEAENSISMTVDNTPPVTGIASKDVKYKAGGTIYATSKTEFILSAMDNLSGIKETDYRIDISAWITGTTKYTLSTIDKNPEVKVTEYKTDSSAWITGSTLTLPIEGTHTIGYRSRDNVENLETEKTLTVIIDNIPPYTTIDFSMKYNDGSNLLVSRNSQVTLNASDGLSGVKAAYYRFDNLKDWHTYSGPFELGELSNGIHTIYYKSVDNVDNSENEKSITIKTIGRN